MVMSRFVILGWLMSIPVLGAILLILGTSLKAVIQKVYIGSNIVFFLLWAIDLLLIWQAKKKKNA